MVNYCVSPKSLIGKTALITHGNSALGYETALDFAKRGGRVIMACRNPEKAQATREKIIALTGNENVFVKLVDMESFKSVQEFADDVYKTEQRLDILVYNAGTVHEDRVTADGFQVALQVNHYSPFLLTHFLLDLVMRSAPSRIVIVSSSAAKYAFGFDENELDTYPGSWRMYAKTALCNIFFAQELAKRMKGTGVTVYSLHPGVVYVGSEKSMLALNWIGSKFFLNPEQGAQTQIYCSLEDGIEVHSGKHFKNCRPVSTYWNARDERKGKRLWDVSEKAVGWLKIFLLL